MTSGSAIAPSRATGLRALAGAVLAFLVLGTGYPEAGIDGACSSASSFGRHAPPGTVRVEGKRLQWPPGVRCRALASSGFVLKEKAYPTAGRWALALVLLVIPLLLGSFWDSRRAGAAGRRRVLLTDLREGLVPLGIGVTAMTLMLLLLGGTEALLLVPAGVLLVAGGVLMLTAGPRPALEGTPAPADGQAATTAGWLYPVAIVVGLAWCVVGIATTV